MMVQATLSDGKPDAKSDVCADDGPGSGGPAGRYPLMERVERERWAVPAQLSASAYERLHEIVDDATAKPRQILAAAKALIAISRLNHANIELTIKVKQLEQMDQRMTKIEERLKANDAAARGRLPRS